MQRRDFMEYMNNVGAGTSVPFLYLFNETKISTPIDRTEVPAPMNMRREQQ